MKKSNRAKRQRFARLCDQMPVWKKAIALEPDPDKRLALQEELRGKKEEVQKIDNQFTNERTARWVALLTRCTWNLSAVLGFRNPVPRHKALGAFESWIGWLAGPGASRPRYALIFEKERAGDVRGIRALVGITSAVNQFRARASWIRRHGDALVYPYDPANGGVLKLARKIVAGAERRTRGIGA